MSGVMIGAVTLYHLALAGIALSALYGAHQVGYDRAMRHHAPMINADEYDLFGWGRKFYNWKPGQRRGIKRRYRKRERRRLNRVELD